MGKGATPALADRVLTRAAQAGVRIFGYFLFGSPTETEAEARLTMEWIRERADRIDFINLALMNLPRAGEMEKDRYEPSGKNVPVAADPRVLETVILDHDWDLARRVMWDYVGIVRSDERLNIAKQRIGQISQTVRMLFAEYGISSDMVELRNIALVSSLVVESASRRKESRGLHYNMDWPDRDPSWEHGTILRRVSGRGPATIYGHREGAGD